MYIKIDSFFNKKPHKQYFFLIFLIFCEFHVYICLSPSLSEFQLSLHKFIRDGWHGFHGLALLNKLISNSCFGVVFFISYLMFFHALSFEFCSELVKMTFLFSALSSAISRLVRILWTLMWTPDHWQNINKKPKSK